jgi:hypothetical protein
MTVATELPQVTLGGAITLSNTVEIRDPVTGALVLTDDAGLVLSLTAPDGTLTTWTEVPSEIIHDGTGKYHAVFIPDQVGIWSYRWVGDSAAEGASEGHFQVVSIFVGAVTDLRDLRVLIPACRRAIDGPQASASDAPSTTLNDSEVLGLVADATAELILNTASADGGDLNAFGNQLLVSSRDPFYMAPNGWMTDKPRSTAQDAAILSQAALNHYFQLIRLLKVSETMKNEGVEWQYSISPSVLSAWLQYLIANRDKAIAALQSINVVMDVYVSLVAERDKMAAAWLEPWAPEIGAPVPYAGGGGSGPLDFDVRFYTFG